MDGRGPYSAGRLLRLCRRFLPNGHDDVSQLLEGDDGEPRDARAHRRLTEYFRAWRDRHEATDDPLCDETSDQFCVGDIAVVFEEYRRLSRLEEKVVTAMGPPVKQMRRNRKTGEMEIDPTWTDPGRTGLAAAPIR